MNNLRILALIERLRTTLHELESEVKSNPESYVANVNYDDVVKYYENIDDDDEAGL